MVTEYQPQNILITGGAGFIGSNFVEYLLQTYQDIHLVNLDLLTYAGSKNNLKNVLDSPRHTFIQGDICDGKLVLSLLQQYKIDTIVHFAAESHVDRSIDAPDAFIQTNIVGTFTLLEMAKRYWLEIRDWGQNDCRFHHISTDEVYGSLGSHDPPFVETSQYQPNSPYSAAKASADHLARSFYQTYGLPVTTSNCSNNYGPKQHQEKLIPKIISCCLQGLPIPIYGDGSNIRDWLYVDDHCRGIDQILRHGQLGETYNIGAENELSNLQIATYIAELMDQRLAKNTPHADLITFVNDRPGHDWRYAIDSRKMTETLQWQPQTSFHSGLDKTIDFYWTMHR